MDRRLAPPRGRRTLRRARTRGPGRPHPVADRVRDGPGWQLLPESDLGHPGLRRAFCAPGDHAHLLLRADTRLGHGLQDDASIPARGQFVIRIRFSDYTGKTVLHCHILNHEDEGMMAALEIVK
ncbi:multicopper oxidase domain-containing protein [Streptomyces sp. NPDC058246]|uniref:multicopper oxidase domain-containing protein n=1 Tax=Streptomyces sp. NPDC058246 TaxID=3346400 RepID=UPI0036E9577F